jgi:hypothetical protein
MQTGNLALAMASNKGLYIRFKAVKSLVYFAFLLFFMSFLFGVCGDTLNADSGYSESATFPKSCQPVASQLL